MPCGVRDRSFFNPHFVIRDAPLRVWIAGLPAAVCGWKLEAVKHTGSNPPVLEGAGYNEVYTAAAGQLYTTKRTALQSFFQFIFRYVSYNKRSFAPDGIKRDLVLAYRGAILYNDGVCDKSCGAVPRNNV